MKKTSRCKSTQIYVLCFPPIELGRIRIAIEIVFFVGTTC